MLTALSRISSLAFGIAALLASTASAQVALTGVNLAGAEFGESVLPGVYNTNYTYPTSAEVDYYVGKGVNVFRLPFRWERLQRSLGGPLDATELGRLDAIVDYATDKEARVVLDPHNYARYNSEVIGGGTVSNGDFADFWARLADEYKANDRVVFGLMNEPHDMPTEQWLSAANAALDSIRNTGAGNLVLVPGNAWTGAFSWNANWYGTPNAEVMLDVVDPGNNYAIEVHQYLNQDSSGSNSQIVSETIGRERLEAFTAWARANNRKAFLGEFAVANSTVGDAANQIGDEAINNMLDHVEANDDVWLGWTWWAGGPWWHEYQFTIEPTNLTGDPVDRPVMTLLEPRLAGIDRTAAADFNGDGIVSLADYVVWRDHLGATGADLAADANNDQLVSAADYMAWKDSFGQTVATTGEFALQVPEATSAAYALAALLWRVAMSRGNCGE